MPISMDRFGSEAGFATYHAHAARRGTRCAPPSMWKVECRRCGFEPADPLDSPRVCPRCHSSAFERVPVPGTLYHAATGSPTERQERFGPEAAVQGSRRRIT